MKPTKPFELLIDADPLLYQSLLASEEEIEWTDNDIWTLVADLKQAKEIFNAKVTDLIHLSGCSLYSLCFSDTKNFRKEFAPYYKGNRKGKRKPVGFKAFKEWAMEEGVSNEAVGRSLLWPNLEADDIIGILGTEPKPKHPRVIYSIDKDLDNIAGIHFKIEEKDDDVHVLFLTLTPEESYKNFLTQCLSGDPVDNISGLKGYGKVKSTKALEKSPTWRTVVSTYISSGMSEADAVETARLVHILHWDDYNMETGKVRLWNANHQKIATKDTTLGC